MFIFRELHNYYFKESKSIKNKNGGETKLCIFTKKSIPKPLKSLILCNPYIFYF